MSFELSWTKMLPHGWQVVPLKAMASYSVSSVDKIAKEGELPVELCNYTDVYKNDYITPDIQFMPGSATEDEIAKFELHNGDVLITKDSESWEDIGVPALVVESKANLLCGYHLAILRPDQNKIIPGYLFRCIEAKNIRVQLELASTGVTRFGLPKDEIGRLRLPAPTVSVQRQISAFLDKESQHINKLIFQKEAFITLLSGKRQALITRALTRGLDKNVKTKDSDTDWLYKLPANWIETRLKYLGNINYGLSQPPEYHLEGTPLIRATNVVRGKISKDGLVYVNKDDVSESKKIVLQEGDIVVVRSGAYAGDSALITAEWEGAIAGFDMIYRANGKIYSPFLSIALLSEYVLNRQLIPSSSRAAQPHLNAEELGNVIIALPPVAEQIKIYKYLQVELAKIEKIAEVTKISINLLKERRITLISSAVTGQIEIPMS